MQKPLIRSIIALVGWFFLFVWAYSFICTIFVHTLQYSIIISSISAFLYVVFYFWMTFNQLWYKTNVFISLLWEELFLMTDHAAYELHTFGLCKKKKGKSISLSRHCLMIEINSERHFVFPCFSVSLLLAGAVRPDEALLLLCHNLKRYICASCFSINFWSKSFHFQFHFTHSQTLITAYA